MNILLTKQSYLTVPELNFFFNNCISSTLLFNLNKHKAKIKLL